MPTLRLSDKYRSLFDVPRQVRYVICTGGRGSGKSFGVSASMAARADQSDGWKILYTRYTICLLYTSPSPRDVEESRMPSSA